MYSIAASRGRPEFVKSSSKVKSKGFVSDLSSESRTLSETPFTYASQLSFIDQIENDSPPRLKCKGNAREASVPFAKSCHQKGVIVMDLSDGNRCTHTEVPPSTLMTLAMELQVSNRGKASKLFRHAKLQSQNSSEDENSESETPKLLNLWVVPDSDATSRENIPNTASQLQPSLENIDFIFRPDSSPKCIDVNNNHLSPIIDEEATKLKENDLVALRSITVSDLVGSKDHVITYSESEDEIDDDDDDDEDDEEFIITGKSKPRFGESEQQTKIDTLSDVSTKVSTLNSTKSDGKKARNSKSDNFRKIFKSKSFSGDDIIINTHSNKQENALIDQMQSVVRSIGTSSVDLDNCNTDSIGLTFNVENTSLKTCFEAPNVIPVSTESKVSLNTQQMSDCYVLKQEHGDLNRGETAYEGILLKPSRFENKCSQTSTGSTNGNIVLNKCKQNKNLDELILANKEIGGSCNIKSLCLQSNYTESDRKKSTEQQARVNSTNKLGNFEDEKLNNKTCNLFQSSFSQKGCFILNLHDKKSNLQDSIRKETNIQKECSDTESRPLSTVSTTSLLSMSSLESMSSTSIQLSSPGFDIISTTSFDGVTPDGADFQEKNVNCQRNTFITDSAFCNILDCNLPTPVGVYSPSLKVSTKEKISSKGGINSVTHQGIIKSNALCHPHPERVNKSNEKDLILKRSCTLPTRSYSANTYCSRATTKITDNSFSKGRSSSVSPSRKVICEYFETFPDVKHQGRKSPSAVISQAVFQDRKDKKVATPVLYLKKPSKCYDCGCTMALCCCSSSKQNPKITKRSNSKEDQEKYKRVGEYGRLSNPILTRSKSKSLPPPEIGSNEWRRSSTDVGRLRFSKSKDANSKIPQNILEESSAVLDIKPISAEQYGFEKSCSFINSPHVRTKLAIDLKDNVTATSHKDACRITLATLKSENNQIIQFDSTKAQDDEWNKQENREQINSSCLKSNKVASDHAINTRAHCFNARNSDNSRNKSEISVPIEMHEEKMNFDNKRNDESVKIVQRINKNPRVEVVDGSKISLKKTISNCQQKEPQFTLKYGGEINGLSSNSEIELSTTLQVISKDEDAITPGSYEPLSQQPLAKARPPNPSCIKIDDKSKHRTNSYEVRSLHCGDSSKTDDINSSPTLTVASMPVTVEKQRIGKSILLKSSSGVDEIEHYQMRSHVSQTNDVCKDNLRDPDVTEQIVPEPGYVRFQPKTTSTSPQEKTTQQTSPNRQFNTPKTCVHGTSPTKPIYSSSVSLSLQPARKHIEKNGVASSIKVVSTSSPSVVDGIASTEINDTKPQYRKWVQEWSSPTDPESMNLKATFQSQIQDYERRDNRSVDSRPALINRQSQSTTVLSLNKVTDRYEQSHGAVSPRRHVKKEVRFDQLQLDKGCEKGSNQNDYKGSRIVCPVTRIGCKAMVGKKDGEAERFQDPPLHSTTDEEDFSGVIEMPTMKVKDIRAKYKVRDYENYAKPRSLSCSSNGSSSRSRKGSEEINRRRSTNESQSELEDCTDVRGSNHVVAQQVMSLFKGALDVEKELAVFQEEAGRKETDERFEQQSPAVHDGHVTTIVTKTYEQTSVQTHVQSNQKPSKLDSSVWPPAEVQDSNNNTCEEKDIKTSVEQIKTESKAVASFDESLDQFYDVLNDLTA